MTREPVLYDPATDTLLLELRPWPAASPAEVNEHVGGEDAEEGLVIHYGPDGLPHAYEVEHASERPPWSPGRSVLCARLRATRRDWPNGCRSAAPPPSSGPGRLLAAVVGHVNQRSGLTVRVI